MNNYRKALVRIKDNYCATCFKQFLTKGKCDCPFQDDIDLLEELVDTTKIPTFEEIKQDWKNLEYELIVAESRELVFRRKTDGTIFTIQSFGITYYSKCWRGKNINITIKEHQLLTKTFKALGWFDE